MTPLPLSANTSGPQQPLDFRSWQQENPGIPGNWDQRRINENNDFQNDQYWERMGYTKGAPTTYADYENYLANYTAPAYDLPGVTPNPTGTISPISSDVEKSWIPGAREAEQIYNLGQPQLDPNDYLGTTMQNLMAMQNPQQNPYLLDMLQTGQSSVADQTMSSLGVHGRGPGSIDPTTGQVSDSALNLINDVGDYTSDFMGNQYQADMNRAISAALGGGDFIGRTLGTLQGQPWTNLQNYTDIVGGLTGTSPQQSRDSGASGWDKLLGLGSLALGFAGLPKIPGVT